MVAKEQTSSCKVAYWPALGLATEKKLYSYVYKNSQDTNFDPLQKGRLGHVMKFKLMAKKKLHANGEYQKFLHR